ncbi:TolC family outer membrane protein [uncultured Pseudacidovorax sp.]|uniref:TolC family outer membrane protein n=1 Tax=uncultured Pseudacidovorax sp. TaxID=679313 RepID=UPI0025F8150F|nr:TolC family outer membrane protein [uncultured Pseudacidovorax sp.]
MCPYVLRGAALAAAALALHGPAAAQSLGSLYDAARGYDAGYQAARAQSEATTARGEQARAGILPQVGLAASASRTDSEIRTPAGTGPRDFTTTQVGVQATQPIYRPANWASYQQGQRQAALALAQLQLAEQDLIVRVGQAYFDLLSAEDNLRLIRAQKAAVAEQLATAQRNFDVGNATITDQREAQARYDLVVAQEIGAENDRQVRQVALDQLVGRTGAAPWAPQAGALPSPPAPADLRTWVALAEDTHPAVAQARIGTELAALETDKARAGHLPTVDATLSYGVNRNPQGTLTTTTRTTVDAAQAGVQLNLPLFAGFAVQNRIRETLALEDQARAQLDGARRNVAQATRTAWLGLASGRSRVAALEAAEASSRSALEATQLGYQVGVRVSLDVLNAQAQLYQTQRDLAAARYAVLLGDLRLRQAAGTLDAAALRPLDALLMPAPVAEAQPSR